MDSITKPQGEGYLVVRVTTARGAIPLADAQIRIRKETAEDSGILYALRSNRDGLTSKVALPTPPLSNSDSPQGGIPFSTYGVDVFKDGYTPLSFQNVPIFPGVVSVQPAVMIPLAVGFSSITEEQSIETPSQNKQFPEEQG